MVFLLFQRGSDELLSQSGAVSNGAAMSPQPHHAADNNNDAKKVSDDSLIRVLRKFYENCKENVKLLRNCFLLKINL